MKNNTYEIFDMIQELSWYFGNQGFDGECCGDLSLVEYMTLKRVHNNACASMQEIGNALNISKSSMSKIIDRIEHKGYVARKISPIDGRVCCVELTKNGVDIIQRITERYADYVGDMLKNSSSEEKDELKSALNLLLLAARDEGFIKK